MEVETIFETAELSRVLIIRVVTVRALSEGSGHVPGLRVAEGVLKGPGGLATMEMEDEARMIKRQKGGVEGSVELP